MRVLKRTWKNEEEKLNMRNWIVVLLAVLFLTAPVKGAEMSTADFSNSGRSSLLDSSMDYLLKYKDVSDAADIVREQMLNSEEQITVYVSSENGDASSVYFEMSDIILEESKNSDAGDYLKWDVKSEHPSYTCYRQKIGTKTIYCYEFNIEVEYFTTLEQKNQVNQKVDEIISSFGFGTTTTEYEKVRTIYDYICETVVYADDLSDDMMYTAWSALFNNEAVCQGYSQLFYKMAKEADLDVRVVPGIGTVSGENHGWNIVKIEDEFYNVDVTWDSTRKHAGLAYKYFLMGDNFEGHKRLDKYATKEFYAIYPMSKYDYGSTLDKTQVNKEETTDKKEVGVTKKGFSKIKPTFKKVTRKKIKLAKVSGAYKYQIKYSTSKKFKKNVKTVSTKKTTYKFKKLKKGKKYYVAFRAYKKINGKKVSTKWSATKKVKK